MGRRLAALAFVAATLGLASCSGTGDQNAEAGRDTLTQRQRDSLVGELPLPGTQGVREALKASDTLDARRRMLDSIAGSVP